MNNRIEELAQGCFEYYEGTLDGDVVEFNYNKFAELLIEECINVAIKADNEESVYAWYAIQQHFGTKE